MHGRLPALAILAILLPGAGWSQHGTVVAEHAAQPNAPQPIPETKFEVPDAIRRAVLFTRYALDVKLEAASATLRARAVVTIRNEGDTPLQAIPLQLSSTLNVEAVQDEGHKLAFSSHTVPTDTDHTGAMHEALVQLPSALAPHAERSLTVFYSGTMAPTARRLEQIGTPPDVAAHSDWDGIREDFTGLRGFGNVIWYPVCQLPVRLGDGDRLFGEVAAEKQRQSAANVSMTVTEESTVAANVVFLDGISVPVKVTPSPPGSGLPAIATATLPETPMGFAVPSIFLASRTAETGSGMKLYARPGDAASTQAYMTAASILAPHMAEWLGPTRSELQVLDLPAAGDLPFADNALLVASIVNVDPKRLLGPLSHVLPHAYFRSPRPWLDEGVAEFMALLWAERQQGREAAITPLDNQRGALSLAESGEPDTDPGQPLLHARDPIYYRVKASYVLTMLRGLVGDKPLAAALQQYDPAQDTADGYFEQLLERTSGQKLQWFFHDWVDRDRGLPELTIDRITPSPGSGTDSFVVAVTVTNKGFAVADVPVTVYSAAATVTERVRVEGKSSATHRFLVHGEPEQVQVNDGTVPEVEASVHRKDIRYATP